VRALLHSNVIIAIISVTRPAMTAASRCFYRQAKTALAEVQRSIARSAGRDREPGALYSMGGSSSQATSITSRAAERLVDRSPSQMLPNTP
jgi:hypothetical protein